MAFTIITQGTFTQPTGGAIVQYVNLPSSADYFRLYNLTQAAASNASSGVLFEWFNGITPNLGALMTYKNSSNALLQETITTGGFSYQTTYPAPEAAVTGTTITNASPAVASAVNSYNNGDRVVIYNSVGALMYSGMTFTISSVSGTAFTLLGLNTPGSAATAFTVRRIAPSGRVEPRFFYITGITQATQAVVTLSEAHDYVVGMKVEFTIPGSFGMTQLNNFNQAQSLPAVITAVTTYTITVNVNTSSYTAFAFPASSGSPTTQLFATVAPAGASTQELPLNSPNTVQTGYNFLNQPFRSGLFMPYMQIQLNTTTPGFGAGGVASDQLVWQACKIETS
jgi:hypothetical protein